MPNAIAAILLSLRDTTGIRPHCRFEWSEGNPVGHLFRSLILGRGDPTRGPQKSSANTTTATRRRPGIHVGG